MIIDFKHGNITRVVNLGTTTKVCQRNFVPKPHPGHEAENRINKGAIFNFVLFLLFRTIYGKIGQYDSV